MSLKVDDVIICKVKKIEGTTVFLDLGKGEGEGSMVLSEVAAGRIRNLRQYVSPNRVIVCKVLKISRGHVELSLRRVTARERDEVLERDKRERAFKSVLKMVGEDAEGIVKKIREGEGILEFLERAREDPKVFGEYVDKEKAKRLAEIMTEREGRGKKVERLFKLKSLAEDGVDEIKQVLSVEEGEVHYLGSSTFSLSVEGEDFREANHKVDEILGEIEKEAGKKKIIFERVKERTHK